MPGKKISEQEAVYSRTRGYSKVEHTRAPVKKALRAAYEKLLTTHIRPGDSVLELGPSENQFLYKECIPEDRKLSWTQVDLRLKGLRKAPTGKAVVGSFFRLPFADETFDHVVGSLVLDLSDPETLATATSEIHRVLRPGGKLIHLMDASPSGAYWDEKAPTPLAFHKELGGIMECQGFKVRLGRVEAVAINNRTKVHTRYDRQSDVHKIKKPKVYALHDGILDVIVPKDVIPKGKVGEIAQPDFLVGVKRRKWGMFNPLARAFGVS